MTSDPARATWRTHPRHRGIEVYDGPRGTKYRVRFTDAGGKRRSKSMGRLGDALAFKAERDRLATVERTRIDTERGTETLLAQIDEWRDGYARHNLAHETRKSYDGALRTHIEPRIGHLQVRQITPAVVHRALADMQEAEVGGAMIQKAFTALSAVLRRAVELGRIDGNPVHEVRVPSAVPARVIRPLEIDEVEAIRAALPPQWRLYVSLVAYAGCRPAEARGVRRENVFLDRSAMDILARGAGADRRPGTKTGKGRSVPLLRALHHDLEEAIAERDKPADYLVGDTRTHGMSDESHRWFVAKPWRKALKTCGIPRDRMYVLRHTYASARIAEQRWTQTEIARQLGHDVRTLDEHYAHLLREATGRGAYDIERAIRTARDKHGTHPDGLQLEELKPVVLNITARDPYGTGQTDRYRQVLTAAGLTDIEITEETA